TGLGVPHPHASLVNARGLATWDRVPAFVKPPIGTAPTGGRDVSTAADLPALASSWEAEGLFGDGKVLVQTPAAGPLVMVQAVFCNGRLIAAHTNRRVREGARGGASHKRSMDLPEVRNHLQILGRSLGWHGALSMDAILTDDGPSYIDVNPRLVEPANAWRAGVDLVALMLDLARGAEPAVQPPGRPDVATHQLLLAVLGTAQRQETRRAVAAE